MGERDEPWPRGNFLSLLDTALNQTPGGLASSITGLRLSAGSALVLGKAISMLICTYMSLTVLTTCILCRFGFRVVPLDHIAHVFV